MLVKFGNYAKKVKKSTLISYTQDSDCWVKVCVCSTTPRNIHPSLIMTGMFSTDIKSAFDEWGVGTGHAAVGKLDEEQTGV